MRRFQLVMAGIILLGVLANLGAAIWRRERPFFLGDPMAAFPRVFLWAWERPEDLSFLDPDEVGVAVLAKTLNLNRSGITIHPRMQPIELPSGIATIAVVRIEQNAETFSAHVREEAVRQILELTSRSASGLQIDFDARVSDRPFYRALLAEIRRKMPPRMKLSITALASWCIYDDWISDLPVDESVPMLFRLGAGKAEVKSYLNAGKEFRADKTQFSIGLSMDELPERADCSRRVYLFNPRPWTQGSVQAALRYVREMR